MIPARVRRTLPELAGRLTSQDRYLIRVVHALRVLTTHQVAQLAFGARDTAADRLRLLTGSEVVDRFRPLLPPPAGTAPYRYVLGPVGAAALQAEQASCRSLSHPPPTIHPGIASLRPRRRLHNTSTSGAHVD